MVSLDFIRVNPCWINKGAILEDEKVAFALGRKTNLFITLKINKTKFS